MTGWRFIRGCVGIFLLASVSGCAGRVSWQERFPRAMVADPSDADRREPAEREADFSKRYRSLEYCNMWDANLICNPLIYPQAVQQGSGWEYVQLARDYGAKGDDGGAARAYWSALTLSGRMVVSRPEKERLRRIAYKGLAGVAQRRSQDCWKNLMLFNAQLADTYLAADQAARDDRTFHGEVDRQRQDLLAASQAHS